MCPHVDSQMIFNKGAKTIQQKVLEQLYIHTQKNKDGPLHQNTIYKINSKQSVKPKTMKLLGKNTGQKLPMTLDLLTIFLDMAKDIDYKRKNR